MKAVLDACVLYPTLLREILLGVAGRGLINPVWSDRILEEWRRAVVRHHPEQAAEAVDEIASVTRAFPGAEIEVRAGIVEGLSLPDENDRHVLGAAIASEAQTIITLNLRDFPGRTLARHGVLPRSPDSVLLELYGDAPSMVGDAVDEALVRLRSLSGTDAGRRSLLKRAGLPRLGKAFDQA